MSNYPTIKTKDEIEKVRVAANLAARALHHTVAYVTPGISTYELDAIAHDFILRQGGIPSSLGYKGFPKAICTSVNDVVCHGIPDKGVRLKDGDIINLDVAACVDGYHGDNSITVAVGSVADDTRQLMTIVQTALMQACAIVRPGLRTREIGAVIEAVVEKSNYSIVKEFVGHGIGRGYHEAPHIFHYKNDEPAIRLQPGMIFTIEPIVNIGSNEVQTDPDGWTVRTIDGLNSAQFEHTILVTDSGYDILTLI